MPYYRVKCAAAGPTSSGAPTTAFALVITVTSVPMGHIQMAEGKVRDTKADLMLEPSTPKHWLHLNAYEETPHTHIPTFSS